MEHKPTRRRQQMKAVDITQAAPAPVLQEHETPILKQWDYPHLMQAFLPIERGDIKEGDLITNIYTKAVWPATAFDVTSICARRFPEHNKFRKMIPPPK